MDRATVLIGSARLTDLHERLELLLPDAVRCRPCPVWNLSVHVAPAEILVLDDPFVDRALLDEAPRLRLIQLLGPDVAGLDLEACARRGVAVANVPWGQPIAEPGFARLVEAGDRPRIRRPRPWPASWPATSAGSWTGIRRSSAFLPKPGLGR